MAGLLLPTSLGVVHRLLPQAHNWSRQPRITKAGFRGWVLHTAVSNGRSVYSFFNGRSQGVESTLYVRRDGTIEQMMHVDQCAHCQLDGNWWPAHGGSGYASMETWDGAGVVWDGRDVSDCPPWTTGQVEAITSVLAYTSRPEVLNHSLGQAASARGWGNGYHRLFTRTRPYEWNRHHACPTDARADQFPGILALARRKANTTVIGTGSGPATHPEEGTLLTTGERVNDTADRPTKLAANGWTTLHLRDGGGVSILGEAQSPCRWQGTVWATVSGLPVGATIQFRFFEYDPDSGSEAAHSAIYERTGTGGNTYIDLTAGSGYCHNNNRLRVQAAVFVDGVTVTHAAVDALHG